MPQGKSNKKRANPKKKGQKGRRAPLGDVDNGRAAAGRSSTTWSAPPSSAPDFPSQRSYQEQNAIGGKHPHPLFDTTNESIYVCYKKSTQRFKDALQSMVPPEIFESDCVTTLVEAAEYIVKADLEVDNRLLSDLKLSIRVRKRVSLEKYGGADEGHSHFIEILEYCWSLLAPRRKKKPSTSIPPNAASDQESVDPSLCNRFEKLSSDDMVEDEADDEGDLPQTQQPRPCTREQSRLTFKKLLRSSDRVSTILFFMSLEEWMGFVAFHFHRLNAVAVWMKEHKHSPFAMIQDMMEPSVAANLAIQQVAALEEEFIHDHPHLNTVYRMLANIYLADFIEPLMTLVTEKSPVASQFTEKHAVQFLGDVLECYFWYPGECREKCDSLMANFLKCWQFRDDEPVLVEDDIEMSLQLLFANVRAIVMREAPIKPDYSDPMMKQLGESGLATGSHKWMPCEYIGSNRSIIHTLRLVQSSSGFISRYCEGLVPPEEMFGVGWRNLKKPLERIQVDMDNLLMCSILPTLIRHCHSGSLSANLPHQSEFLTGFVHIKAFVDNPDRPVSWAMAVTIHTILTSIIEIQDPAVMNFIATTGRRGFETFFSQIEKAEKIRQAAALPPLWSDDELEMYDKLESLGQVPTGKAHLREELTLSKWNPYCGGVFLAYLAYVGNLKIGAALVDQVGQLQVTLHLFNALKQVHLLERNQLPMLDWVFEMFQGCKAIWEGENPIKGQFQTRWCMLLGLKCGLTRLAIASSFERYKRTTTPLCVENVSNSFCQMGMHDSHDAINRRSGEGSRAKKHSSTGMRKRLLRSCNTLSAMTDDEFLLAMSLANLGVILHQFYDKLFVDLGWMPQVESIIHKTTRAEHGDDDRDTRKYRCMHLLVAEKIMRPLDDGDTTIAARCAQIMADYFKGISPDKVLWFTPRAFLWHPVAP